MTPVVAPSNRGQAPEPATLRFGRFELRLVERRLLVDGAPAPLGSRAFELLVALIERRDRIVGKGELMDLVWPGLVVEEGNLAVQVANLRKIVGRQPIASVPGLGYRFAAAVDKTVPVERPEAVPLAAATDSTYPSPGRLPQPISSFVGREQELADLDGLLAQARLLTLTGIGGIGKTRLAIELATAVRGRFADGVRFVDLAPVASPALVADAVLRALDATALPKCTLIESVCDALRRQSLLLVLDNCEHVLSGCTQLVDGVMREAPLVTLLATGRERLHLHGEQAYPVPPLSLPRPGAPADEIAGSQAVHLFMQRARQHRPHFQLRGADADGIAELCARLDGIPLALELAAARLPALSVAQIVSRLGERFRMLIGGDPTAPERQQTLRQALDWSHALLSPTEQRLFAWLAVFSGGFTVDAAQQICQREGLDAWDVLDLLEALVDKSLVVGEERRGAVRYRLLETVRHFALERLAASSDEAAVRDRHLEWFAEFAEHVEPSLTGPQQESAMELLDSDRDNFRAALEHAQASRSGREAGLRLAAALNLYWDIRGMAAEGRGRIVALLDADSNAPATELYAKALNAAGVLAWKQGDALAAEEAYRQSLAMRRSFGDRRGIAISLNNLGIVALGRGNVDLAREYLDESLRTYREIGDETGASSALVNLASVYSELGDIPTSVRLLEESLAIARATGSVKAISIRLQNLGVRAEMQNLWHEAESLYSESLAIARRLGDRSGIARSLGCLARVALEQGDARASAALRLESLKINRTVNDRAALALTFEGLADWASACGAPLSAARFWGGAQRLREHILIAMPRGMQSRHDVRREAARAAAATPADFDRSWQAGRMTALECLLDEASCDLASDAQAIRQAGA